MMRRENGRVYLDISEEDFDHLVFACGYAAGGGLKNGLTVKPWINTLLAITELEPEEKT